MNPQCKTNKTQSRLRQRSRPSRTMNIALLVMLICSNHSLAQASLLCSATPAVEQTKDTMLARVEQAEHSTLRGVSRIIGGAQVKQHVFTDFVQGNGCGGSLIWDDMVVTAAHCAKKGAFEGQVLVSAWKSGEENVGGAEYRNILSELVINPKYDQESGNYDFMLFKIAKPSLTSDIKPVSFNRDRKLPHVDERLTVIGFGQTEGSASEAEAKAADTLRCMNIEKVPYKDCHAGHDTRHKHRAKFCAGIIDKARRDICEGDAGGPLYDSKGTLIGIVNQPKGCAKSNVPGIYGRISSVADWIDETICSLSSYPPGNCPAPTQVETDSPTEAPATLPPTTAPAESTGCADDPIATFSFMGEQRDCAWLANEGAYKIVMCTPGWPAYEICFQTCKVCG
jgi:secreted trypsin-like serine protease